MKPKDREEVLAMLSAHDVEHHKRKKKQWYERLALSLSVAGLIGVIAHAMHLELALKGVELLLGAVAHFLFFGTYE